VIRPISTTCGSRWCRALSWSNKGITIEDDDEEIPHLVIFTVTDLTKVIGGITVVIIWGEDFAEVELVETAIAFFCSGR